MKPSEVGLACERCGGPAVYCDSVPDAGTRGYTPAEPGYRLTPLCWLHAFERRTVATARVRSVVRCEGQGLARVDRHRADGGCVCLDCGRPYRQHPPEREYPDLTVLCDGSVVKL